MPILISDSLARDRVGSENGIKTNDDARLTRNAERKKIRNTRGARKKGQHAFSTLSLQKKLPPGFFFECNGKKKKKKKWRKNFYENMRISTQLVKTARRKKKKTDHGTRKERSCRKNGATP